MYIVINISRKQKIKYYNRVSHEVNVIFFIKDINILIYLLESCIFICILHLKHLLSHSNNRPITSINAKLNIFLNLKRNYIMKMRIK